MNLYQLDAVIEDAISQGYERYVDEDGVLVDEEGYRQWMEHLQGAVDAKIENIALYIKNLKAEAAAIREEEKELAKRRHRKENHAEWLADYLAGFLRMKQMDKFETAKCAVRFTSSESVAVTDGDALDAWLSDHDEFLRYAEPTLNKAELKKYLKQNEVPGAELQKKKNISIK